MSDPEIGTRRVVTVPLARFVWMQLAASFVGSLLGLGALILILMQPTCGETYEIDGTKPTPGPGHLLIEFARDEGVMPEPVRLRLFQPYPVGQVDTESTVEGIEFPSIRGGEWIIQVPNQEGIEPVPLRLVEVDRVGLTKVRIPLHRLD